MATMGRSLLRAANTLKAAAPSRNGVTRSYSGRLRLPGKSLEDAFCFSGYPERLHGFAVRAHGRR